MHFLLALIRFLGPKPLTASLVAQIVVLGVSLKLKDKTQVRQTVVLLVGLTFAVVSIGLRTPSPPDLRSDILGTIAAVLFLNPAVQVLLKLRKKPQSDQTH